MTRTSGSIVRRVSALGSRTLCNTHGMAAASRECLLEELLARAMTSAPAQLFFAAPQERREVTGAVQATEGAPARSPAEDVEGCSATAPAPFGNMTTAAAVHCTESPTLQLPKGLFQRPKPSEPRGELGMPSVQLPAARRTEEEPRGKLDVRGHWSPCCEPSSSSSSRLSEAPRGFLGSVFGLEESASVFDSPQKQIPSEARRSFLGSCTRGSESRGPVAVGAAGDSEQVPKSAGFFASRSLFTSSRPNQPATLAPAPPSLLRPSRHMGLRREGSRVHPGHTLPRYMAGLAMALQSEGEREHVGSTLPREGVPRDDPAVPGTLVAPGYTKLDQGRGAVGLEDVLVDSFGRKHTYLRVSLTERCNLRCTYCMPAEGAELSPQSHLLTTDEVVHLASIFVGCGVDKIRLTGGEPTVRRDIEQICERVAALPGLKHLAMTTNGMLLRRKLPGLQGAGLTQLNISLDTLVAPKFELLTRRKGHEKVMEGIRMALELGYNPLKVNCVVMRGFNDDEILDFVEMTKNDPINVRFIEFMPFDGNVWRSKKMMSFAEMMSIVKQRHPDIQRLRDHPSDTAKNFRVPGYTGSVSFITSMTSNFCAGCNRIRLLADGNFKVCLFGPNEVSLRDAVRAGANAEEIQHIIHSAIRRKMASHAGMFEIARTQNRPMIHIGG